MANLEEDIKRLHESIDTEQNQELFGILDERRKNWLKILNLKAQGALIRSRFQNIEWMDIPSKFFLTGGKKMDKNDVFMAYVLRVVRFC